MRRRITRQPVRDCRTGQVTVRTVWRLDPRVGLSRIKAKAPVHYAGIARAVKRAKEEAAEKARRKAGGTAVTTMGQMHLV